MYTLITILIILASISLILVVLVQKSKGGGLASGFSSSNQIMGVRKTTDFVEKATWGLAIAIAVLCLASASVKKTSGQGANQSMVDAPVLNTTNTTPDVGNTVPPAQENTGDQQ